MSLFGEATGVSNGFGVELLRPESELPSVDQQEILKWEKDLVGVYISEHPLNRYLDLVRELQTSTLADLDEASNDQPVAILGLLNYLRTHITKKGHAMAFGSLEDMHGVIELIFFPRTWQDYRSNIEIDRVYLIRGKVRIENGDRAKIIVDSIENNLDLAKEATEPEDSKATRTKLISSNPSAETKPDGSRIGIISGSGKSKPVTRKSEPGITQDGSVEGLTDAERSLPPPPPNFEADFLESSNLEFSNSSTEQSVSDEPGNTNRPLSDGVMPAEEIVEGEIPNPVRRSVVVEIQAEEIWRDTCRTIVQIAGEYDGKDALHIRVSGHQMVMEFPNQSTHFCPELLASFRKLSSVVNVEVS